MNREVGALEALQVGPDRSYRLASISVYNLSSPDLAIHIDTQTNHKSPKLCR